MTASDLCATAVTVSTHLSRVCNSQTVQCPNSNVDDLLPPQPLHHLGFPHMHIGAVAQSEIVSFPPVWRRRWLSLGGKGENEGASRVSYQVHTTPDLVRAKENCAPHSIWQTPWPFSLSMFWGMLQPSLPPRPSFPKSPSPQENTNPGKIKRDA